MARRHRPTFRLEIIGIRTTRLKVTGFSGRHDNEAKCGHGRALLMCLHTTALGSRPADS